MFRFFYVILLNCWRAFYVIPTMRYKANRPARYTLEERYDYAKWVVHTMQRSGKVTTKACGLENLPKKSGYVLYSNHQGKYDALGIVDAHERPLSIVMDEARSHVMLTAQFLDLLESKRLVLDDMRQGLKIMKEIARELKEDHKNFLIFPEGGYTENRNMVCEFKGGSFKCAQKAKAPIVPVAIINSWKVFGEKGIHLGAIETEVHFLPPLYYSEYMNMNTNEIASTVKTRIQQAILNNLRGEDLDVLQKQLSV